MPKKSAKTKKAKPHKAQKHIDTIVGIVNKQKKIYRESLIIQKNQYNERLANNNKAWAKKVEGTKAKYQGTITKQQEYITELEERIEKIHSGDR